jgi:hypothetical protein
MDKYTRVDDNNIYKYINSGHNEKKIRQEDSSKDQLLALKTLESIPVDGDQQNEEFRSKFEDQVKSTLPKKIGRGMTIAPKNR